MQAFLIVVVVLGHGSLARAFAGTEDRGNGGSCLHSSPCSWQEIEDDDEDEDDYD
jgi:hypothetical protein